MTSDKIDRHKCIHQARKRFKKIRGALRLVRPALGEVYSRENAWFRDTARQLAAVRDAEAVIETFDKLRRRFGNAMNGPELDRARAALVQRRQRIADSEVNLNRRVKVLVKGLQAKLDDLQHWTLGTEHYAAVGPGLKKTYARGRRALKTAYRTQSVEDFHELRKRVKYHWYHIRLLEDLWPEVMGGQRRTLPDLSELLGDDHDLAVFQQFLEAEGDSIAGKATLETLRVLANKRQQELRCQIRRIARRVYAEKRGDFYKRIETYWEQWKTPTGNAGNP